MIRCMIRCTFTNWFQWQINSQNFGENVTSSKNLVHLTNKMDELYALKCTMLKTKLKKTRSFWGQMPQNQNRRNLEHGG